MAEILEFSSTNRKKDDNRDSSARDAAIAEVNKQKLRNLKTRLDERPRMSKVSEREIVATNLWDLLERIEGEGIKKSRIVQSWHGGATTDSTKRLYTYTLPRDLPQEERTKRASQLTQKTAGYRALAEQAAKLTGGNADSFLAEVFRGTEYESQNNSLPDELSAPWVVYIRDVLLKMCNWIAKRNDLNDYFLSIIENDISISDDWTVGVHGNRISDLKFNELCHREHLGGCVPSRLLFTSEKQKFAAEVLVAARGTNGRALPPSECGGSAKPCDVETYSELYLSIAPLGKDRLPIGVFETRVKTDIIIHGKPRASFEDYYDQFDGKNASSLNQWQLFWCPEDDEDGVEVEQYPAWVRTVERRVQDFGWTILPGGEKRLENKVWTYPPAEAMDHDPLISVTGCRLFQEIDLINVHNILGRYREWDLDDPGPDWAQKLDSWDERVPVESPSFTAASLIEKNLYYDDAEERIDTQLEHRAELLTERVGLYIQERKKKLEKHKSETLKRYEV